MTKELRDALKERELRLQALAQDEDIEAAHGTADKILVETIVLLAGAEFGKIPEEVQKLISEYYRVPKWYA